MKRKPNLFFCVALIFLVFSSCTKDKTFEAFPECVTSEISNANQWGIASQISKCQLNGETVYLIEHNECCDLTNYLYDENCNLICQYGGWSGYGCDSLLDELTEKKIIFKTP